MSNSEQNIDLVTALDQMYLSLKKEVNQKIENLEIECKNIEAKSPNDSEYCLKKLYITGSIESKILGQRMDKSDKLIEKCYSFFPDNEQFCDKQYIQDIKFNFEQYLNNLKI